MNCQNLAEVLSEAGVEIIDSPVTVLRSSTMS